MRQSFTNASRARRLRRVLALSALAGTTFGALAFINAPKAKAETFYQFTSLGFLLNGSTSFATGINDAGRIVGSSTYISPTDRPTTYAFDYYNGAMHNIGSYQGYAGNGVSYGYAINSSGEIAGETNVFVNVYTEQRAATWNGSWQNLGTLYSGPNESSSTAYGINNSGAVVGRSTSTSGSSMHAFSYSNGTMTDLGTLTGGSSSAAYGINNTGTVVGESTISGGYQHAFSYSGGKMSDLGVLSGSATYTYTTSVARAINTSGTIVGYSSGSAYSAGLGGYVNVSRPFLYTTSGGMQNLGSLGGYNGQAMAINDSGTVVGWSDVSNGSRLAFIYSHGVMSNLTNLCENFPANWYLNTAYGINSSGDIVGEVENTNTSPWTYEAFLLTPVIVTVAWNNSSGNGLWDQEISANWDDITQGYNPVTYIDPNSVLFDDTHNTAHSYNVALNTLVLPASVTVNNNAGNYVISGTGSIGGSTGITKNGAASLTLSTANTYTGATTINAGTLSLGTSGSIADSATINVASGATFNVSAVSGGFTLGSSTTQTLEGSGNVTGNITIGANGTLSPGIPSSNTIGTLTVNGNITLTPGSIIAAQVTPTSGVNDELISTGNVYLGNANGNITATGTLTNGESFTVIQGNVYGWFNNNGGGLPTLNAGLSWNSPLQINNSLPGAANTYQKNIVLSVTNSTPIYSSNLPATDTYAGFNISEHGGGRGTQVTFLGGTVSTATSLSVQFSAAPADATHLISDYAAVNGTNSDTYVLELSYTSAQLGAFQPTSPVLAVDSGGLLKSAVLLDNGGSVHEILGAYNSADFSLGDYGVDTTNDVVWAVLNYSAGDKFGVSSRLVGDAAGTGQVTPQDISIVLSNQGDATNLWSLGDFNNTNSVTPQDISQVLSTQGNTAIGTAYQTGNGLIISSPVPEPGSLALLALGSLRLVLRRKRIIPTSLSGKKTHRC